VDRNRFLFATFAGKVVQSMVVALLGYYAFERISSWW
jgi:membrane protein DedA with SNARE-associated domain